MKPSKLTARPSHGNIFWVLATMLATLVACSISPRAQAQSDGVISGQILDVAGKPWADIGLQATSEQGAKADTRTDKDGNFSFRNLKYGVYTVAVILPAPNPPYEAAKVQVHSGDTPKVNANFKDIVSKQGSAYAEQQKKQEEDKQKFQGMKQHFDAGIALLAQAGQAKADLAKAQPDQRDGLKAQALDLSGKAVTELEAAKAAAPDKDPNMNLI